MLRRPRPALLAAGAGVLAVGLVLSVSVRDAVSASDDTQSLRKIEEAYEYITRSYVERVDSAQLAEDAIEGMLAGLDPHSVYISASEMNGVRESFAGSFQGIGIYYEFVPGTAGRDSLVVLMPIAGGPSDDAGLMAGDRIVQIGDTTAVGLDTDDVQRFLKGPRGTTVRLVVSRPGYPESLPFTITRDEIPLNTVIATYMIDDETGYIRLQRFAQTSAQEIRTAIDELRREGMTRLVLDLRDNGGGLLDQAYQIADEFLPEGNMIVYTDSRHPNNRRQYRATAGGHFETAPVMVLVNENSASASEIVAGALQDHDRAFLVGRRTFGKGLVQQQFAMSDGSVLQMTVSRYFTPSGRLIQTPYTVGEGEEAYFETKRALRAAVEDVVAPQGGLVDTGRLRGGVPDSLVFRTDGGRTVYGGGGVLPDYIVALDSVSAPLRVVIGRNLDNDFARVRIEQLGERFRQEWSGRETEFVRGYRIDDATFSAFLDYAGTRGVRVVDTRPAASTAAPADTTQAASILVRSELAGSRRDIETRIKAFMARRLFDTDSWYPVVGQIDPVIQAAMQQWQTATASLAQADR
ncbi:MAG TPA: S41 family peptidase [Rubricoccaceae bacterium]|jgi:carboxyl-terminal processing protease